MTDLIVTELPQETNTFLKQITGNSLMFARRLNEGVDPFMIKI